MNKTDCVSLKVLDNVPFGDVGGEALFYALRLERPEWADWKPGQFVMIRPRGWELDMLWGRPFSICRVTSRDLVLFFQVVGRGTKKLAELKTDDEVVCWGPLGNSFAVEAETPTLLLAGGIGIAPFIGYAHSHPKPWNLHMDFGHRMPLGCYPFESINEKIMAENHLERAPEDLDKFIGRMDTRIAEYAEQDGLVLACGPTPFLKTVRNLALKHNARCQLSLENRMACGVGACLGCVSKTASHVTAEGIQGGRTQTCTQGPIFWAQDVELDEA